MTISTISRTGRYFYFNKYHFESSSLWIQPSFIRHAQFAIRMIISFLVGSFLAYGTSLNNQLDQQYLIPVMTILCSQETIGLALASSYQMLSAIVPISIFLFIVQKLGLGYHHYLIAEVLLLVSSIFIAYRCSQVQTRKIGLLFNAIFFAAIVNQNRLPSTFAFQLLEAFVIGMCVSLMVSFIIFPHFSTIEVENRFKYCLTQLQKMQTLIIEGFLSEDEMSAQMSLSRSSTIEQMVRTAMSLIQMKLAEARFEPIRYLQRLFNRRRRHLINLTLNQQEELITSMMFHVTSLQLMVKQCSFNNYHRDLAQTIQPNLLHLDLCQSIVISSLTGSSDITTDELTTRMTDMHKALESVRVSYIENRFNRIQNAVESSTNIRSEDHLSHAFFLFQLGTVVRLLTTATMNTDNSKTSKLETQSKRSIKQLLIPDWTRLLSAFKSMLIIGVGSIFVMVPRLAKTFENGQWILIALCMTQGDTVGGAFNTMKMRLVGTLLGAMWAYITYLSVHDNVYQTFGMLVPWVLIFGYLKPMANWGYTASVAAFTPVLINLGRIPYGDNLPAGNFALLRIEANLVGIAIAIILTLAIFPILAIDLLKSSIRSTLEACCEGVNSIYSITNQLFKSQHQADISIDVDQRKQPVETYIDAARCRFHLLISTQGGLIGQASMEPTFWWFKNHISTSRYVTLAQQQIDLFRMLHNIDEALIHINDHWINCEDQIENLPIHVVGDLTLPNLHTECSELSQQLSDCLKLWASYFTLTQTRCYRLFRQCTYSRTELTQNDLLKHEQCLIELHQTAIRLRDQHQATLDRILKHFSDRIKQGETSSFLPYQKTTDADLIFIAISTIYYSTTQLVRAALALGTSIHTIFELETTRFYQAF